MNRRQFSAAVIGLARKAPRPVAGGFVDPSHLTGHRLRDRALFPAPKRTERVPVVIVGGGMAGLCAGWRLAKRGMQDFVILEMESQAGGNSRWGENEITGFPWAAHYVPVPGRRLALVRELMEELGALNHGVWEERYLCHSPQERLFLHGKWQEGLEPEIASTAGDREQYRRFQQTIQEFAASGEFQIPVDSVRVRRADLDRVSMAEWLKANRFDSPYLHWLVDYSCRDDYGASARATSAWAGIHYFAARGAQEDKGPLTWPEGNGWITRRLIERLAKHIRTGAFVHRIERAGTRVRVVTGEAMFDCQFVIFAAPTYLAPYMMEGAPALGGQYSPWLTANLTLERWPVERGVAVAWDNVIYQSPGLGYVVATHQSLRTHQEKTVWTYYWALAAHTPAEGRRLLLDRDWNGWKEAILNDLARPHPDIRECVSRIDILRMGHAMIRPVPGFLTSEARRRIAQPNGRLVFANSDLSGISIFEEAQFRGVRAADYVLETGGRA